MPFERELSILAVRSTSGQMAFYPLVENHHQGGILRKSRAPAPATPARLQHEAEHMARRVLEKLDYMGVLALELFELEGTLWANEMAPRVHNSGHWTLEGADKKSPGLYPFVWSYATHQTPTPLRHHPDNLQAL